MRKTFASLLTAALLSVVLPAQAMEVGGAVNLYKQKNETAQVHFEAMARSTVAFMITAGAGECFKGPYPKMVRKVMGRMAEKLNRGAVSYGAPFDILFQLEMMQLCMENGGQSDPEARALARMFANG